MTNTTDESKDLVLIVEDTAANYEVIQTFLKDIDVECENAFDGMEAVTMCSSVDENHYSLILMDINMPYLNGFETTAKIRDMGIKTPVVAITATSKDDGSLKNADNIFDSVLFKPFNYLEFYTAISPYIKNAMAYTVKLGDIFQKDDAFPTIDVGVCDIHQAIENMGNNPRLFIKHFNNFRNNNVDLCPRLQALVDKEQYSEASGLCHSIKGLAGMLGFTDLYNHIIELEWYINDNSDTTGFSNNEIDGLLIAVGNDIRLICQIQF